MPGNSEHNKVHNTKKLEDLVNILASAIGSLTNPSKLENTFHTMTQSNITDKTIKKYIDLLKDAFLIDIAARYDIKGKKYINSPMKIYFVDPGLRNARLGFRQIEETHLMEKMKKAQEERPLLNIKDSFKKIIVVGSHIKLKRDEMGITTMGIRQFLLTPNSLDL